MVIQSGAGYLMEFAEIVTKNEQVKIDNVDEEFRKATNILASKEHENMELKQITGKDKTKKRNVLFPVKLHELLCHSSTDNSSISWNPKGTFFIIHDPIRFSEEITPKIFRTRTYSSFTRQLKIYDFKRVADMEYFKDQAYYHELFLRSEPELCRKMKRISVVKQKKIPKVGETKDTDNFDSMSAETSKRKAFESLDISSISSDECMEEKIMYDVCYDQNQNEVHNLSQYFQDLNSLEILNQNIESLMLMSHSRRKLLDSSYLQLLRPQRMYDSFPKFNHIALQRYGQSCFHR